jgi:hypothetical protein
VPHFSNDAVMPREPYGYAHWSGGRGLVCLRNPWIVPQSYAFRIDELVIPSAARNLGPEKQIPRAARNDYGRRLLILTVAIRFGPLRIEW